MYNHKHMTFNFLKDNSVIIGLYILIISLILPIEAVGFSKYTTNIIETVKDGKLSAITKPVTMICVVYIVTRVLSMLQQYTELHISANLNKTVRENLFKSYLNKVSNRYKETGTGKMISKLNLIPHVYDNMVYEFLNTILPYGLTIIVLVGYFFYVDKRLGIFLSLTIFTLVVVIMYMSKERIKRDGDKYEKYFKLNDVVQDKMTNVYSVIANSEVDKELQKSTEREEEYKKVSLGYEIENFKYHIVLNAIILIILVGSMYIYYQIFKTKKYISQSTVSFMTFFYLLKYINSMKWELLDFLSKFGILNSVNKDFVDDQPVFKGGTKRDFITDGKIKLANVGFGYDKDKQIHTNLNIEFQNSKITAIYGESGSGKTTILKLIMGFYPYTGKITVDNTSLEDVDITYLRNNISVVNQNIQMFDNSIYENIRYSNNATDAEIDKAVKDLNINIIDDYNKSAGANGSNLSNGQKQYIMMMRAFLKNKKILILDEPTSSLDKETKKIILDMIKRVSKNKTTIIVTHDDEIKQIADIVYTLK